jgi:hypothetical protein
MTKKHVAYGLIGLGAVIQVVEGIYQSEASIQNVTYDQTAFGALIGPLEKKLPIPLGYMLLVAGVLILIIPVGD